MKYQNESDTIIHYKMAEKGFIYILTNPAMPGLVKVGKTTRVPHLRINDDDLSATGIPRSFEAQYYAFFDDIDTAERIAHKNLASFHFGKEFFKTGIGTAINAVEDTGIPFKKLFSKPDDEKEAAAIRLAKQKEREKEEADKEQARLNDIAKKQLPMVIRSRFWVQEHYIYDKMTQRLWRRNTNILLSRWSKAMKYVKTLRDGGYSEWRLPTIEELIELRKLAHSNNMSLYYMLDRLGFYDAQFSTNYHKFYSWHTSSEISTFKVWTMHGAMDFEGRFSETDKDFSYGPRQEVKNLSQHAIWPVLTVDLTESTFRTLSISG